MTALLTAVLASVALAGCAATQTGGNPTTAPTTGGQQTSSQPTSDGSDTGLSIAKFVNDPCSILTATQVTTLGSVRTPQAGSAALGPNCVWKGQDVIKNSTYDISVTKGKDFETQVENVKSNPVFVDKKIDGVRVVSTDQTDGAMYCLSSIQVSKSDSVTVQFASAADERATKKPCPETERVAQLIITNLKG
ncbi:DUF3558 domain-containing protein [Lentzea flaviverrucosa]|uniref:DUF3558 domain-containing protein n=1 Tax=Lentzea flaviverrucosa TaxID=200379 RepID=A0A1H9XQS3_9PSEU|nr:DUF3558 domain-containing protein [Lentzea flaviverrucosa]RDI19840.1 uncharacterized protein DUF3558 [Lentzea flaviverrucosa]SES48500.1 Protein of unknown function [Lentzea flaviverrucosa]